MEGSCDRMDQPIVTNMNDYAKESAGRSNLILTEQFSANNCVVLKCLTQFGHVLPTISPRVFVLMVGHRWNSDEQCSHLRLG
jgi:hypothetical protein